MWGREKQTEGRVKLSPLKLVEETASPFWVWSITFAGHLRKKKKRKEKKRGSLSLSCSLSLMLLRAPAALLIEPKTEGSWRGGGESTEEKETCALALPPSIAFSLHFFFCSSLFHPSPVGTAKFPPERCSWHKISLIIFPLSGRRLRDSRREWRSSRPELVWGWQKV